MTKLKPYIRIAVCAAPLLILLLLAGALTFAFCPARWCVNHLVRLCDRMHAWIEESINK